MDSKTNRTETIARFADLISYELRRAERYRIFLSLVVINLGPIIELGGNGSLSKDADKEQFLGDLFEVLRGSVREVDLISGYGDTKIGLLLPETPRQGAEAAARRISETLYSFCGDYFRKPADYLVPVEISSFPDAAGARSVASYIEDFARVN
ncbi:MAG TPA: GGDEF domain-containing protein [candidate division Zixibacteria bacterium]|nr:GGDEF domain-containing protein [candidate division Zixibacteria bacterium]